jgi:hypothetical protein
MESFRIDGYMVLYFGNLIVIQMCLPQWWWCKPQRWRSFVSVEMIKGTFVICEYVNGWIDMIKS